jgi:integrase
MARHVKSYPQEQCTTITGYCLSPLNTPVRQGYLGRNPAELVDPPSPRKKTMRTLTPGEVALLFESIQDNYYYPVIYTAVNTGLRQAELLGLRWRDLDLDYLSISVNQVLYKRRGTCQFKEPKNITQQAPCSNDTQACCVPARL